MNATHIEWCDRTWNPITGCPGPKVSPGCDNCYAERAANTRLRGRCGYDDVDPFKITFHPGRLKEPAGLVTPQRIFVGSMGDIFHEDVSIDDREHLFWEFPKNPHHTFMLLTKRPEVALWWFTDGLNLGALLPNVWLGVTVCNQDELHKLDTLREIPAALRYVSFEPLLSDLGKVNLEGIGWVICGGETGPNARPAHPAWFRSLRDQCRAAGTPFFFKGWGEWAPVDDWLGIKHEYYIDMFGDVIPFGLDPKELNGAKVARVGKRRAGRLLDGREWNEFPKQEGAA